MLGSHNVDNALAAIAAARHAGVPVAQSIAALAAFKGVRRRMELTGTAAGISIYDDFAHHPTAITTTIEGLRRRIGKGAADRGARGALQHHAHGCAQGHARAIAGRC